MAEDDPILVVREIDTHGTVVRHSFFEREVGFEHVKEYRVGDEWEKVDAKPLAGLGVEERR